MRRDTLRQHSTSQFSGWGKWGQEVLICLLRMVTYIFRKYLYFNIYTPIYAQKRGNNNKKKYLLKFNYSNLHYYIILYTTALWWRQIFNCYYNMLLLYYARQLSTTLCCLIPIPLGPTGFPSITANSRHHKTDYLLIFIMPNQPREHTSTPIHCVYYAPHSTKRATYIRAHSNLPLLHRTRVFISHITHTDPNLAFPLFLHTINRLLNACDVRDPPAVSHSSRRNW